MKEFIGMLTFERKDDMDIFTNLNKTENKIWKHDMGVMLHATYERMKELKNYKADRLGCQVIGKRFFIFHYRINLTPKTSPLIHCQFLQEISSDDYLDFYNLNEEDQITYLNNLN